MIKERPPTSVITRSNNLTTEKKEYKMSFFTIGFEKRLHMIPQFLHGFFHDLKLGKQFMK